MAHTHIIEGPWATELPGGWSGKLQLNAVNYTQGATSVADVWAEFGATQVDFAAGDVGGTRGDQSPDWAGSAYLPESQLTDYRFRFWVIPKEQRLVNPPIGSDINFILWNTWPEDQTVTSVVVSDAAILDPALEPPDVIKANAYFTTTYQILTADGDIDESFTISFTDETITINVIGSVASTFTIIPDVPVSETWEYLTDTIKAFDGSEQRIALRKYPRVSMNFTVDILDFEQRRDQYITLFRNMGIAATVPLYQHATQVTQASAAGATKVFFDPSLTQMQEGAPIVVIDPATESFQIATVSTMDADGANITNVFVDPIPLGHYVYPAMSMLLKDGSGIVTNQITGKMKVKADDVAQINLIRPGSTATITTLNNLPVMERKIRAGHLTENFSRRLQLLNYEPGVQQIALFKDPHAEIEGVKRWEINRYDGETEDYMRKFIDTVRGGQKAWLLPTWMPDLILNVAPSPGAGQLTVTGSIYNDLFSDFEAWQYIMLQYDNLDPTYHQVSNLNVNPDGTTTFTITPGLDSDPETANISTVSFMTKVRGEDRITRTHYHMVTEYAWGVRTTDDG